MANSSPFSFNELTNDLSTPTIGGMNQRTWSRLDNIPVTPTPGYFQGYNSVSALQVLRDASHGALITSENQAYTKLYEKNLQTEAEMRGLREAYQGLLNKLGTTAGGNELGLVAAPRHHLNRNDYPNVTIWFPKDWQNHSKNKKGDAAGFHQSATSDRKDHDSSRNSLYYIQNKDGVSISEGKAIDLCHRARRIWEYLHSKEMAPPTWGRCQAPALEYYRGEMYKYCPDLTLCDGDWKVDRLATDNYSGWFRHRKEKSRVTVKEEKAVKGEDEIGIFDVANSNKRKAGPATNIKPEKVARLTTPNNTTLFPPVNASILDSDGSSSAPTSPTPAPPHAPISESLLQVPAVDAETALESEIASVDAPGFPQPLVNTPSKLDTVGIVADENNQFMVPPKENVIPEVTKAVVARPEPALVPSPTLEDTNFGEKADSVIGTTQHISAEETED
ncbi:hypothetical protein H0H93_013828, partial [Arthromyces matolae]